MTLDIIIVIGFLAVNLAFGVFSGRGITNIKEYALGNRNFSTATITATIIATWLAGSSLSITVSETYSNGLYYVIPGLADGISFFIIAYFYAPRMAEFLGKLSVAEAMGNLYGSRVRTITAVTAIIIGIGNVAAQFAVSIVLLNHFLGISSIYAAIITCLIVILYSTYGGIKAVTFTDIIQFFTFCITLPMTAFFIWQTLDSSQEVLDVFTKNPAFDYKEFFSYHNPSFLSTLFLFLFFIIPGLDPIIFQRISMAKNVNQVSKSFTIAGFVMMFLEYGVIAFCGVLLLANNTLGLNEGNVVNHILDNYIPTGFKGFFIVGIVAMIMSTADSYINSSAILLSYDLVKSIGIKLTEKKQLILVRISALIIGVSALFLGLSSNNLLELILSAYSLYMPVVSVPLILAIFGFRSSSRAVLIGMAAGFLTVVYFKLFLDVNGLISGMLANLIFFIGSHYILGEQGGWVGIKNRESLDAIRLERKRKINRFILFVKNFNLINFCKNNTPTEERIFVYFGLFSMLALFSNAYSLPRNLQQYVSILNTLYYSVLTLSTIFITYPFWAEKFKNRSVISVIWNIAVFYNLAFSSSLLTVIGVFDQIQVVVLITSLVTVAVLMRWQVAMLIIISGIIASIQFYKMYVGTDFLPEYMSGLQFKITYALLLISTILIAFFKPKQDQQKLIEDKAEYFVIKIQDQEIALEKALKLKQEFLANLEHEGHTPISGIVAMGEALWSNYDKLSDKQIRDGLEIIAKSSDRLLTLVNNLIDVSKLTSMSYQLNKTEVNLSELVYDRLDHCKRLHLDDKELRFLTKIDNDIKLHCDLHYITSVLDNLIVNAIKYTKEGDITTMLKYHESMVEFSISDQGVAIPKKELYSIFDPFTVGSRTRTKSGDIPNGQLGMGLALCKLAIKAHDGEIYAESDGRKGAVFKFRLPL